MTGTSRPRLSQQAGNRGAHSRGREPECAAFRGMSFSGVLVPCGEPGAVQVRQACVHEHVREAWVCREHVPGGLCLACFDLPGGLSHECPLGGTEVLR